MTNEEAKFILGAYRSGGRDANDPLFAEALRQAREDPGLGEWFAREQAHSAGISEKLGEVVPPPQLREAILAGVRVSAAPARARWSRPLWIGVAASVAAAAGALTFWPVSAQAEIDHLAAFALKDATLTQHGGHGHPAAMLHRALQQPNTCLSTGITVDFEGLRTSGCRTLRFDGHDVVELCFSRDGIEFHFYALRRADFPKLPAGTGIVTGSSDGFGYVTWTHEDQQFLVVSRAGVEAIKKVL